MLINSSGLKMKINYLKINGFKSIRNVKLKDVSPFIVLAGANGAGKSNFVDALVFLSKVIDMGVSKAVSEFGGIRNLIDPKLKSVTVSYYIEFEIQEQIYQYRISILLTNLLSRIVQESLKIIKDGQEIFDSNKAREKLKEKQENNASGDWIAAGLLGALGGLVWSGLKGSDQVGQDIAKGVVTGIGLKLLADEKHSSNDSFLQPNNEAFQTLKNTKIFRIDPFAIKNRRNFVDNPEELKEDGSNIAAVLENLEKDDELREQVTEWMSVIVPEMTEISVKEQEIDDSRGLFFEEDSGSKFPAHMVSDGTIYALCLLVSILTRTKQPGVTIIEEPERGLHPKAISELISFIREHTSSFHPIILTTHSESVVRSLELTELYFVSKYQGKTQIKDVRNSGVDKSKIPLDTAWLTNLLGGGLPW